MIRPGLVSRGLFEVCETSPGRVLVEHSRERVTPSTVDSPSFSYRREGIGEEYVFSVTPNVVIDATVCGSPARYINPIAAPMHAT